jgi:hypothetical protein
MFTKDLASFKEEFENHIGNLNYETYSSIKRIDCYLEDLNKISSLKGILYAVRGTITPIDNIIREL